MKYQTGFSLFELMIAIAIISILSAIGIPAYQGYMQKAAMTDVLQTVVPYRTAVELCILEQGNSSSCQISSQGIPAARTTRYVSSIQISQGIITLNCQQTLQGLSIVLEPNQDTSGGIEWNQRCVHSNNTGIIEACQSVFRANSSGG